MSCDCCGKVGTSTTSIRDIYKTDDVQDVCDGCAEVINKQLRKLQSIAGRIQSGLLKRFVIERKEKYSVTE